MNDIEEAVHNASSQFEKDQLAERAERLERARRAQQIEQDRNASPLQKLTREDGVEGGIYIRQGNEAVHYCNTPVVQSILEALVGILVLANVFEVQANVGRWKVYVSKHDDDIIGVALCTSMKGTSMSKSIRRSMIRVARAMRLSQG